MKDMSYFTDYAEELVSELTPNARIKKFLTNTSVIGAYAENTVIRFVERMVDPLRVSTGAVISPETVERGDGIPQIDAIIWQPNPLPSIFTSGNFGLIPRQSVMGIIEIKRSTYSGIGNGIKEVLDAENELTTDVKLIQDGRTMYSSIGVVCVREKRESDVTLRTLIEAGRVVVLSEIDADGKITPLHKQILLFVNFLVSLRLKAKLADGTIKIDIPALQKEEA
jgi:hypothetical protein